MSRVQDAQERPSLRELLSNAEYCNNKHHILALHRYS